MLVDIHNYLIVDLQILVHVFIDFFIGAAFHEIRFKDCTIIVGLINAFSVSNISYLMSLEKDFHDLLSLDGLTSAFFQI